MAHTVSTLFTTSFPFYDLAGDLVTGLVNADFVKSAYLTSNGATTATVTVTEVTGQSGNYSASLTPTEVGRWKVLVSCDHEDFVYRWDEEVEVVEAEDPDAATTFVAQGRTWSDLTDPILDADGDPITNGEADITVTLFDSEDVDQSTGITVAHVDAGQYRVSKDIAADAAVGSWGGLLTYDDGAGLEREQVINFTVITPAEANADPEAVAAAIMATPMGTVEIDTLGYYIKSLFTRPVRSGNG